MPAHPSSRFRPFPALNPGDLVYIVAPSYAIPPSGHAEAEPGRERLESWGLEVEYGRYLTAWGDYTTAPADVRAAEITAAFMDDRVRCVMCYRGGAGCAHILPYLSPQTVAGNPKALVGFSDITALHAIMAQAGVRSIHGPMLQPYLSETERPVRADALRRALMVPGPMGALEPMTGLAPYTICGGRARGPVLGGNLNLLANLVGTPWEVDLQGSIVILEDIDEALHRLDRYLTQLISAGCLDAAAGVVLGQFENCEPDREFWRKIGIEYELEDLFRDRLAPLGIPALFHPSFGHRTDTATIPLGAEAEIDADAGTFTILESACE